MNTADRKMTAVPAENHSPHPRCPEKTVKRAATMLLVRDALRTDLGPDKDVNWYITMFGANDAALFDAAGKSFPDLLGSCVLPAR